MSISLTEAAAQHIAQQLAQRGQGLGLRVGMKKSGCSGFSYAVDYADAVNSDDQLFESHGIKIVVDSAQLAHLDGLEIDFVKTNLLNQGFEFHNPNAKDLCGCGESFRV